MADDPLPAPPDDGPPPVLSTWRNVYLLILGELALLVATFYALTRWSS